MLELATALAWRTDETDTQRTGDFRQPLGHGLAQLVVHGPADFIDDRTAQPRLSVGIECGEERAVAHAHEAGGEFVPVIVQADGIKNLGLHLMGQDLAVHENAVTVEDHR